MAAESRIRKMLCFLTESELGLDAIGIIAMQCNGDLRRFGSELLNYYIKILLGPWLSFSFFVERRVHRKLKSVFNTGWNGFIGFGFLFVF